MNEKLETLTPKEIVKELDKFIIGQEKAKKAVAIALRNRMRRQMLPKELRDEIAPKNIIMIGPTGVGKTEIARRLSKLVQAPFIKVEATKYTEVGYVGRDVESMVRDLLSVAITMVKSEMAEGVKEEAAARAEDIILDLLLPGVKAPEKRGPEKKSPPGIPLPMEGPGQAGPPRGSAYPAEPAHPAEPVRPGKGDTEQREETESAEEDSSADYEPKTSSTREKFREMLRAGKLDKKMVEIDITKSAAPAIEIFSNTNFEEMDVNFGPLANLFGSRKKKKRVTIDQAKEIILAQEMDKLVDDDRAAEIAKERVEEMGIIFIDEIDKVAAKEGRYGADVSREGVQRDILPIVEGSQVNTKYGLVDTAHILFIAAGAFHTSKPSDLIPELQGRFPLRVELEDLGKDEFHRILTQPENSLTKQYRELLKTEEVTLDFHEEATQKISEIAASVNAKTENIGARRLHTIMELLLEDVSFNAPELKGQTIPITPAYVEEKLTHVLQDQDLSRYIL